MVSHLLAIEVTDRVRQFYEGIETGEGLNTRLRVFVSAYKEHRGRLARSVSVLDIGCGREAVLSAHIEAPDRYTGCDIVAPRVPVPDFSVVDLNEHRLSEVFAGRTFDVIFCGELIEHVFSPDDLLEDLRCLMTDQSLLVLSTPNLAYWVNRLLLLAGISPLFLENSSRQKLGRRLRVLGQGNSAEGHIRVFTHRAMLDLLRQHPLRLARVVPVPIWRMPVDRLLCRVAPNLSPGIVYLLERSPE